MANLASCADRVYDRECRGAQFANRRGSEVEAEPRRRQNGVEGPAVADIADDAADAGKVDCGVELGGKCRNAVEGDAGPAVSHMGGDRPAGAFENKVGAA